VRVRGRVGEGWGGLGRVRGRVKKVEEKPITGLKCSKEKVRQKHFHLQEAKEVSNNTTKRISVD
jgi:hypothetical protein